MENVESTKVQVTETTEEWFDYSLDVLPPVWGDASCSWFGVGEPISHTENGAVRDWFARYGGKHWTCQGTKAEAREAFAAHQKSLKEAK